MALQLGVGPCRRGILGHLLHQQRHSRRNRPDHLGLMVCL
jgi:hypothetical protein